MPHLLSAPATLTQNRYSTSFARTLLILIFAWVLIVQPSFAQQHQTKEEKETVSLNFVNADIQSVIKAVSMITGKNFIVDQRVNGTVNIISNGPIAKELVYPTLLSALRLQGFAAIEQNGFVKILPEADAKLNYTITTDKPVKGGGDKIVTQVYQLQYENAAQLLPVLRPLISPNNVIAAYPANNTLVITDYAENVRRINRIIQSIDQPSQGEITDIKLQYASAVDVAQLVSRLVPEASQQQNAPGATPKVIVTVDPRSNTLYIRSENPSFSNRIKALVMGMDTPTATPGNVHVVYLRNAEATKVAETLRALLGGGSGPTSIGATSTPTASNPALSGLPNATQPTSPTSNTASAAPVASTIQAYAATNSLVIIAPDHMYNQLRSVIDKLDARRAQVFVEALIVEVTTDLASEFGIQWQDLTGATQNNTQVIGGTNFGTRGGGTNIIDVSQNLGTVGQGLNIGVVRGKVTLPGIGEVLNLGVLARALETDSNANVLSTPNILTLDNEEAKIVVGNNVPFVTGSYTQTASTTTGSVNPFQTIERRDIGIQLKVKPQVAEGGAVKMQLFQEVSDVDNTINTNGAGLATTKRSIESTILVDDGQIVVIGGLIRDRIDNGKTGVPGLSSIPVLGALFRTDSRRHQKTNLMVFLRPYILRDDKAATILTGERYDYIRNEQVKTQPDPHFILPNMNAPVLPDLPTDNNGRKSATPINPSNTPSETPPSNTPPSNPPTSNPSYQPPANQP